MRQTADPRKVVSDVLASLFTEEVRSTKNALRNTSNGAHDVSRHVSHRPTAA